VSGHPSVLVLGAGGHAKVVIELIRAGGRYHIAGVIGANSATGNVLGVDVIGTDADLPSLRRKGLEYAFVAIGDNGKRSSAGQRLKQYGFQLINAISPAAIISPTVLLGQGIAVMAGAVINAQSRVDEHAIINTRASVDHDCHIGDGAHIAPGCALAGNVTVGRLAFLGVGVHAIPGVRIGESAIVGAGACIVRDVPAHALARGVPARVIRSNATG
jgi:UDP-perosamine 4-acetyltransferase